MWHAQPWLSVTLRRRKKEFFDWGHFFPLVNGPSRLGCHGQVGYGSKSCWRNTSENTSEPSTASGRSTNLTIFWWLLSAILVSLACSFSTAGHRSWSTAHSEWLVCWIMSTWDCRWSVALSCLFRLSETSGNPRLGLFTLRWTPGYHRTKPLSPLKPLKHFSLVFRKRVSTTSVVPNVYSVKRCGVRMLWLDA